MDISFEARPAIVTNTTLFILTDAKTTICQYLAIICFGGFKGLLKS
jgi:hypothetical protein